MSSVLVTLHGGCFVGGSSAWDVDQTELLSSMGYKVYQIDFNTDTLKSCLESLRLTIEQIKSGHQNSRFFVLGRSSGGYLAKVLFDEGLFDKAIYLAPVFNPLRRGELVPHLGNKSKSFFKDQSVPETTSWSSKELLLLAKEDENVPLECFTPVQQRAAIYLGPKTHGGLITTTSLDFQGCVQNFLSA